MKDKSKLLLELEWQTIKTEALARGAKEAYKEALLGWAESYIYCDLKTNRGDILEIEYEDTDKGAVRTICQFHDVALGWRNQPVITGRYIRKNGQISTAKEPREICNIDENMEITGVTPFKVYKQERK